MRRRRPERDFQPALKDPMPRVFASGALREGTAESTRAYPSPAFRYYNPEPRTPRAYAGDGSADGGAKLVQRYTKLSIASLRPDVLSRYTEGAISLGAKSKQKPARLLSD